MAKLLLDETLQEWSAMLSKRESFDLYDELVWAEHQLKQAALERVEVVAFFMSHRATKVSAVWLTK